jgi:outer membrane protein OmpA-like peptidoglycan-associated protein
MRATLYVAILATGLATAPAFAAPDPSVGDVVKALTITPGASRGSRPVTSAPATTAAPAVATPSAPVAAVEGSGALDLDVQFASGKAELTPQAKRTLDILGQALTTPQLAKARMRIEGHTDTTGSREANLALSWERAKVAVAYLQERFGIQPARLEAVGRGQDDLLIRTGDNVTEPRNRRVHVVNLSE